MKPRAADAHFGSQMAYYALHIFVLPILFLYDNSLRLQITHLNLLPLLILIINIATSTYLFHITGKNPGTPNPNP